MAHDGKITLATEVDTDGIKYSENDIRKAADKAGKGFKNLGITLQKALSKGDTKVAQLTNNFRKATAEVEKQAKKVDELKKRLSQLESGEVNIENKSILKIQSDFDEATTSAKKTKAEIDRVYQQLQELQMNAFTAPDTGEVLLTPEQQAEFDKLNAQLDELEPKLTATKEKANGMGKALKNAVGTATQAEIKKTNDTLLSANNKLNDLSTKANIAGQKLENAAKKPNRPIAVLTSGFDRLGKRLLGIAKRVVVFSLIIKALRSVTAAIKNAIMSDDKFRNSVNQLKAAFWVAFAPIYDFVIPALRSFIGYLTKAVVAVSKLFAKLSGNTFGAMVESGKNLKNQSTAYQQQQSGGKTEEEKRIENQIKALEKQNKELNKQKKAKQKIQQQQEKANKRYLADFDEISILSEDKDESELDVLDEKIEKNDEIIDQLLEQLDLIQEQKEANKSTDADFDSLNGLDNMKMNEKLEKALKLTGAAFIALGTILLICGHIGWGIGFILMGATLWGIAEASSDNGETIGESISNFFKENAALIIGVSIAMLVIGIIICCCGHVTPLSIGLILVGAVGLAAEVALNWNFITEKVSEFFNNNAALIVGVSLAMLALGVILCCCGIANALSVGLIVAGAVGIAAEVALNWNFIVEKVQNFLNDNAALIVGISLAMLALGIILCCCGIVSPLSIGLIVAGAVGIAAEVALNWNFITEKVNNFLNENSALIVGISVALLVLGIVLCCCGIVTPLSIGLIVAGAVGLAAEVALNWEFISTKVTEFFDKNKALIVAASAAMLILGIILVMTGVGLPLGIALIAAGAVGLVTEAALNWDFIVDKIKEVWEKIKAFWNEHIAKYFTAEWWGALFANMLNGAINIFEMFLNFLTAGVREPLNGIIKLINKVADFAGLESIDIPQIPSVSLPRLPVPALAAGAVIPPNKEFLAVLGDQKSGPNVEAPLSTIKQAVAEAMGENGGRNQTVILQIDGREFGRVALDQMNRESKRVGASIFSV